MQSTKERSAVANKKSIQSLTDREKDAIDFETKQSIQRLLESIRQFERIEKERVKREEAISVKTFLPILSAQTSAEQRLQAEHRRNVIWFLKYKLSEISAMHKEQQEIRLARQIEMDKAFTRDTVALPLDTDSAKQALQDEEDKAFVATLSPAQIQALEADNHSMLEGFQDALEQVKKAEKSIIEIAALHAKLSENLSLQSGQIDSLYEDAIGANEAVKAGNIQLVKAKRRQSIAIKWLVTFLLLCSFILILLDTYYS